MSQESSSIQGHFDEYCAQKAAPPGSSVYYALRQAPLDRIDDRPMRRASLAAVEDLLAANEEDALERKLSALR